MAGMLFATVAVRGVADCSKGAGFLKVRNDSRAQVALKNLQVQHRDRLHCLPAWHKFIEALFAQAFSDVQTIRCFLFKFFRHEHDETL